jgi:outer membrane protein OmpA-like peptidoglycan-associated protein
MMAAAGAARALAAASVASLALAACATDRVTLLPNEDGHPDGAVAVIDEKQGREVVVDRPLTRASLGPGAGAPRPVRKLDPSTTALLGSLPPGAVGFILTFLPGTTTMTPDSRPTLDAIRQEIARRPGVEVQVTGHTDTMGSDAMNDRLSQERAESVVRFLIGEGFSPDILSAVGRGEREPLVPTGDEVSNEANRRVEVIVR